MLEFPWTGRDMTSTPTSNMRTAKTAKLSDYLCKFDEFFLSDESSRWLSALLGLCSRAFNHHSTHRVTFAASKLFMQQMRRGSNKMTTEQQSEKKARTSSEQHFSKATVIDSISTLDTTFLHTLRHCLLAPSTRLNSAVDVVVVNLKIAQTTTLSPSMKWRSAGAKWTIQSGWMNYLTWLQSFFPPRVVRSNVIAIWFDMRLLLSPVRLFVCSACSWLTTMTRLQDDWKIFNYIFMSIFLE